MNETESERKLIRLVTQHLNRSIDALDNSTLAELHHARRTALEGDGKVIQWNWPLWGFATVSVAVLATLLWVQDPISRAPDLETGDIELLASMDSLELYENLEFYDWLAEKDHAS